MKQNRGDWTDVVRRTLKDAEQPLPEGGWERLMSELEGATPASAKVRSQKNWIRFAAAAAAVLVCVSLGIRVGLNDVNVLKRVVMGSETTVSEQIKDSEEVHSSESDHTAALRDSEVNSASHGADLLSAPQPLVVVVSESRVPLVAAKHRSETILNQESEGREAIINASQRVEEAMAAQEEAVFDAESEIRAVAMPAQERGRTAEESAYRTADYDGLFAETVPRRSHEGGSVALSAGGIVTSSGGGVGGGGSMLSTLGITDDVVDFRNAYQDYSYDHKQPLSFGLTFRKEFAYGLSLETGLVYSLLRSEVTIPGATHEIHQKLHMLGIPLRVNWAFLRRGGFSLYVGAGGMAEKCVSAHFGSEKMPEKQVQWSVVGAVGAQYKLAPWAGVYFEPQVSHYFTQTTLRTSRTDSSVALNLQFGVRFTY